MRSKRSNPTPAVIRRSGGGEALIIPGATHVALAGQAEFAFDYDITVSHDGRRAVVTDVRITARPGGSVTARRVAQDYGKARAVALNAAVTPIRRGTFATPTKRDVARAIAAAGRGGRHKTPLAELESVARAWKRAHKAGKPTIRAVMDSCNLTEKVAIKRIGLCRDPKVGLLPPSDRSRRT